MIQTTITLTITELDALITHVEQDILEYQTNPDDFRAVDRTLAIKLLQAANAAGINLGEDRFILNIGQEI